MRWITERWNNRPELLMYLTYNRSQANLRMRKLNGSKFENNNKKSQLFIGSEIMSVEAGIGAGMQLV